MVSAVCPQSIKWLVRVKGIRFIFRQQICEQKAKNKNKTPLNIDVRNSLEVSKESEGVPTHDHSADWLVKYVSAVSYAYARAPPHDGHQRECLVIDTKVKLPT